MVNRITPFKDFLRNSLWLLDYCLDYIYMFPFKFKGFKTPKRILIIELKFIGDMIVTTPTIKALKQKFPEAKIDILVPESMKDVLYGNPHLNEILQFDYNFKKWTRELRGKYDLAVILHNGTFRVSKMLFKARIPFRIGCTKVGLLENKGLFLHRKTLPTYKIKHKVDDNLDVVKTIGVYPNTKYLELYCDKKVESSMKKKLPKKYFVIHNTSRHAQNREWIPERFAETVDILNNEYKTEAIITGMKEDYENNQKIIDLCKTKIHNISGTTMKEFFAIVKNAQFVISIDTSTMHVAAGFNVPVVALFGAGTPRIWHPYSNNHRVVFKTEAHTSCMKSDCYLKGERFMECMKAIQVNDVLNAVRSLK